MSGGDWTVYCDDCQQPVLLIRRGVPYRVGAAEIVSADPCGETVARCRCGALATWKRHAPRSVVS